MKKKHMEFIAGILLLALILTGCGRNIPEAPTLIEPLAANESFRPVEYGDIGLNRKMSGILMGMVSPEEYCHFFLTAVEVSEVSVSVGDYVSEGDVLAVADIEAVRKTIDDRNLELANLTGCHETEENIYSLTRKKLEYERLAFAQKGDITNATAKEAEIGILDENRRYSNMLYEHKVSDIKEDIAKKQDIINDGTLKARVSGRVVYCKDLSEGRNTTIDENVVVIADYNDCHIEVTDMGMIGTTVIDFDPSKYEAIYTVKNGQKKYLDEYPYSKTEKLVIENKDGNPPARFRYADGTKLENAGETVPIFFIMYGKENVLRIEKESLFQDGDGDYVYVKTETGKEKRYLELGVEDKCYKEVVSGLSEGELVYYSAEQVMPDKYDEYEVSGNVYEEGKRLDKYAIETSTAAAYYSEYEGVLSDFRFHAGDYVNAGDVICEIKTDQGNAVLTEMKNSIDKLSAQYNTAIKSYDEQLAAVDEQIYELDNPVEQETPGNETIGNETATVGDADTATPGDAEEEYVNPYARDILDCERQIIQWQKKLETINYEYQLSGLREEYEKISKGNDGNGSISIYANASGTITEISGNSGRKIQAGTKLFSINTPSSSRVSINATSLGLGQKVTFKDENEKIYYGEIICASTDGKNYVTTVNDRVYITSNVSLKNSKKSYISMEDEGFYELDGTNAKMSVNNSVCTIPDCVALPGKGIVYSETDKESGDVRYYVWKIVDDTLVKQYITLGTTDGDNICVIEGLSEGDVLAMEPLTGQMEE